MNLNLKRPLVFFDLETTGINISKDRVVEISLLKITPDQKEQSYTFKVNPEIPIPLESSMFHKIYDEEVKDCPKFSEIASEIATILEDADLAGYNSNKFDIPMLMEEFLRAGVDFSLENRSFVDVQNIFHQMEQRTLKAAYKFYCDQDLTDAHSAEADVRATFEVLKAQLVKYEGVVYEDKFGAKSVPVVNDMDALHEFTNLSRPVDFAGRIVYNDEGEEVFSFGKHKGVKVEDVFLKEPSYYSWMLNGDFPLYTKKCLKQIWERSKEKNKAAQVAENTKDVPKTTTVGTNRPKPAFKKESKKSGPITNDMLEGLKNKFGK